MSRRRPPRGAFQRLQDGTKAQRTGGAGLVYNSAPIPAQAAAVAQALSSVADVTQAEWQTDRFVLTSGGAQTKTLTYLPVTNSLFVFLNTEFQDEGASRDWTVDGQTLSVLTGMGALTDDILTAKYQFLTGQPELASDYDSNYATAVMADSPVAYWRLNEASGNALDFTTNNHDGAFTGSPTRQAASLLTTDSDTCLAPTANGQYFTIPYDAAFHTGSWTLEWWSGKGSGAGATVLLDWPGRLRIVHGEDFSPESRNSVEFYTDATNRTQVSISPTALITADHYYAISYDASDSKIRYYNGAGLFHTSSAIGTSLRTTTEDIKIGSISGSFSYIPTLDEVAWYDRALSAAEIDAHWDAR